uniref:Uncharacterized protein n=1 Tax=Heterorhabditis bacteriophora TaxID=37862 RepID=A0A1I7WHW9_HETBA
MTSEFCDQLRCFIENISCDFVMFTLRPSNGKGEYAVLKSILFLQLEELTVTGDCDFSDDDLFAVKYKKLR